MPQNRALPSYSYLDCRPDLKAGRLQLLDLRSPKEYARGHVPGARNVPLLDDAERHEVGCLYKKEGQTVATQRGLELFAAKARRFLEDCTDGLGSDEALALYCWRGGLRSHMVASWLRVMGHELQVFSGGYKRYRGLVLEALDALSRHPLVVLTGRTGVGKSALLQSLPAGFPLIDFELCARHRGSAFGDLAQPEPPPAQQTFENRVADAYLSVRGAPRLLVEIENYIGPVALPKAVRDAISSAPMILLEREFDDRVERLATEYARGWTEATFTLFCQRLRLLERYLSRTERELLIDLARQRDFRTVAAHLLTLRYDKVYDKSIKRHEAQIVARFNLSVDEAGARRYLASEFTGS